MLDPEGFLAFFALVLVLIIEGWREIETIERTQHQRIATQCGLTSLTEPKRPAQ